MQDIKLWNQTELWPLTAVHECLLQFRQVRMRAYLHAYVHRCEHEDSPY